MVEVAVVVRVSVVLTVRNDPDGLATVLASLAGQTFRPAEIVVVDGGSDPGRLVRQRRLIAGIPNARLIETDGCNIAEGRNIAIRSAGCDVIACIDAGCRAEPDWLARVTAPLADGRVDVVGGAYRVEAERRFARLVGLLTLPGQLRPVDPGRFNPSARSLAFRRSAWRRAGGFPDWLYTAEDTLFDLKLRLLEPPIGYVYAADAVVVWEPRSSVRGTFFQFYNYGRGEGRIVRGGAGVAYHRRRYAAMAVWLALALTGVWRGWPMAVVAGLAVDVLLLVRPWMGAIRRVERVVFGGRRVGRWWRLWRVIERSALAGQVVFIGELVAFAQWLGFSAGQRDRRREPETFVGRLVAYTGRTSMAGAVPAWRGVAGSREVDRAERSVPGAETPVDAAAGDLRPSGGSVEGVGVVNEMRGAPACTHRFHNPGGDGGRGLGL